MSLPNEVSRCLGRRDWTPETEICPQRAGCARFLAANGQFGQAVPSTPWHLWLCTTPEYERRIEWPLVTP
jgi:hypothetical protein